MRTKLRKRVWTLAFLGIALTAAWPQSEVGLQSSDSGGEESATPAAPSPNGSPAQRIPSILGLDTTLDAPPATAESFLLAGASVSQGTEAEPGDNHGDGAQILSSTRAFGSLHLVKFSRHSETAVEYVGGGAVLTDTSSQSTIEQLHRLNAAHRILWQKGSLSLGDSFGDLPGGSFASSAFGGVLASQLGFPSDTGLTDFLGASEFGGLQQQAHITNVSMAELNQALTPRSSVTFAGAYSITDYFKNSLHLVNTHQISTRAGYDFLLNPRDEVGVVFEYRRFQFPESNAPDLHTSAVQVFLGHRISRRADIWLGAGPEITSLGGKVGSNRQVNVNGGASLRYRLRETTLELSYDRLVTKGSGFFAGANSDIARASVRRPLERLWEVSLDAGFARNRSLQGNLSASIPSTLYQYVFVGAGVQRRLGQSFDLFARYQVNDERFGNSFCAVSSTCSHPVHLGLIGLGWHIRPIRLD